jgi:hypothetical protein
MLYGCGIQFSSLRDKHRLKVSKNRLLRIIFLPKRDEMIKDWLSLTNEGLHNFYPSPSKISIITLWIVRSAGHVASTLGEKGITLGFWWEGQKEVNH